jgi:hypothetical protein
MFLDALLKVATAQQVTADAASNNTVDFGNVTPKRKIGVGEPLGIAVFITAVGTNTGSAKLEAIVSAAANLGTPTIVGEVDLATADLAAGKRSSSRSRRAASAFCAMQAPISTSPARSTSPSMRTSCRSRCMASSRRTTPKTLPFLKTDRAAPWGLRAPSPTARCFTVAGRSFCLLYRSPFFTHKDACLCKSQPRKRKTPSKSARLRTGYYANTLLRGDDTLGEGNGNVFNLEARDVSIQDVRTSRMAVDPETGKQQFQHLTAEEQFSPHWMTRVSEDTPERLTSAQDAVNLETQSIVSDKRPRRK